MVWKRGATKRAGVGRGSESRRRVLAILTGFIRDSRSIRQGSLSWEKLIYRVLREGTKGGAGESDCVKIRERVGFLI